MNIRAISFFKKKYDFVAFIFADNEIHNSNVDKTFETKMTHKYTIKNSTRFIFLKLIGFNHYNYIKIKLHTRLRSRFKYSEIKSIPLMQMFLLQYENVFPENITNYNNDYQLLLNIEKQLEQSMIDIRTIIDKRTINLA